MKKTEIKTTGQQELQGRRFYYIVIDDISDDTIREFYQNHKGEILWVKNPFMPPKGWQYSLNVPLPDAIPVNLI